MDKDTLRMQMLSGVITEGEYKAKLEEGAFDSPFTPKVSEPQKGGGLQLKNAAMKVYSYIKKNGFNTFLTVDGKNVGDRMNHDFSIQVLTKAGHQGEGVLVIQGNKNKTNPQVVEKLQNDIIHDFPFLKKSNQSNPSQLLIKLEVDPKANVSETLNEHYIAGGIVGVGAINNPFEGRKKESYEDAFEHFLGQKYNLKEIEKYEGDLPKNDLKKLEGELKSAGHDAKLSGINLDFILVKTPNKGELQVVTNDEGQYVVQPRNASNIKDKVEFGPTTKSSSGEKEDNLATGIKYVVNYFDKLK